MYVLLIVAYAYLSLMVAFLGRRTNLGFWRSFALSLLITPLLTMLLLFFFYEARTSEGERRGRRWAARTSGRSSS